MKKWKKKLRNSKGFKVYFFLFYLFFLWIKIYGKLARVFQHFLDQLKGKNVLDWRLNYGEIRVLKEHKEEMRKSVRSKTKLVEDCK